MMMLKLAPVLAMKEIMSFEPFYKECLECDLYRVGDGKSTIARCLVEEGHEPPPNCPINREGEE